MAGGTLQNLEQNTFNHGLNIDKFRSKDILIDYENFDEELKKECWFYVRFSNIILNFFEGTCIELHKPRSSKELYTYNSDKLWSMVINIMNMYKKIGKNDKDIYTTDYLFEVIHNAGGLNFLRYWGKIFNRSVKINEFIDDIKFYLYSSQKARNMVKYTNNEYRIISLFKYIRYEKISFDYCKFILSYVINNNQLTDKKINMVYTYLTSKYIDPCVESENRRDIINLLYDQE